ncbi:MAG TPA: hypothetical protein VF746_16025 [Longimicrobium sp.]|jgi:hypothetical protein
MTRPTATTSTIPHLPPPAKRAGVLLSVLAALAASGCNDAPAKETVAEAACQVVAKEVTLPDAADETSGLAASRRHAGVYWTHDDSGNQPVVFAVDASGQNLAAVQVTGATNRDWEDAALGPCPGGDCLYLADTGNNDGDDDVVALWRVPEPAPTDRESAPAERFTARFPQGSPDTEALFVLPGGEVYLVTKGTRDPIELYRWPTPLAAGQAATLQRVRRLAPRPRQPGDRVTGASASPDGRWVAVRTYSTLAFYRTPDLLGGGQPAAQVDLTPLGEPQGEAVELENDGAVTLTSEGGGHHLPGSLSRLACKLP